MWKINIWKLHLPRLQRGEKEMIWKIGTIAVILLFGFIANEGNMMSEHKSKEGISFIRYGLTLLGIIAVIL